MQSVPKVNILLSTYNGEKYLAEQLDSLLSQTYPNIVIYVRDDGSKDHTLSIIQSYLQKCAGTKGHRMVLLENSKGENAGYMESFWTLLRESESADYYAFCDQDDFWLPDKIELGVKMLEKERSDVPLLYSSSFTYCDENLNYSGNPVAVSEPVEFKDVLFYTPAFGFTVIINKTLRSIALSASSLKNIPHDGWCQKIAASMGKFIYDPAQTARYRRHNSTVTYVNANRIQLTARWLKNDIFGGGLSEYRFVLRRFYEEYAYRLEEPVLKYLIRFMEQPVTFPLYWNRLFFPRRLRPSIGGETALRLCFLLNR